MIDDEETDKIKKLISSGKSDYKIGKELGHSPNTVKKIREKYKISKVGQENIGEMHFKNPIDNVRDMIKIIRNIVEMEDLKAEERKKWEKLLEKLQEIVRVQVDNRINDERADAVEENNVKWRNLIEQGYVKKGVVTDLKNAINMRDNTIARLNYTIDQRDQVIASTRQENEYLKNRKRNLLRQKVGLENKNKDLNEFIENHLDDAGRRERENLRDEREELNLKKADFDRHVKIKKSELDSKEFEIEKNVEAVEKREIKLDKQEENIKNEQQELKTTWKKMVEIKNKLVKWEDLIRKQIDNIKERWKTVLKTAAEQKNNEKRLQKWQNNLEKTGGFNKFSLPCPGCRKPMLFDAIDPEINQKLTKVFGKYVHPECMQKRPKLVTLSPVSYSGTPIVRSGFSPFIRSGGEPSIVMSGLEPVVKPGFPSVVQSGEEFKVFVSNGDPIYQSGVST